MNPKTTVFNFDIETLDTNPSGIILSLGVVAFELNKVQSFEELVHQGTNIYFDQKEQISVGRTKSQDTLDWWSQQGDTAGECLNNPNQKPCKSLYKELSKLYSHINFQPNRKETRWFSRGYFDIVFMDDFCRSFKIDPMIKFWTWRDTRSFLDALGLGSKNERLKQPEGFIKHNSHHDAAFDAYMIQRLLNNQPYEIEQIEKPLLPFKVKL